MMTMNLKMVGRKRKAKNEKPEVKKREAEKRRKRGKTTVEM